MKEAAYKVLSTHDIYLNQLPCQRPYGVKTEDKTNSTTFTEYLNFLLKKMLLQEICKQKLLSDVLKHSIFASETIDE